MSHIAAGSMRDRAVIEQFVSSSDGQGGQTAGTWKPFLNAWVKLEPMVGQARLMAMDQGTENPTKVYMRFRNGVTPAMRLNVGGRIFSILQPINIDNADITLELMCSEVTG